MNPLSKSTEIIKNLNLIRSKGWDAVIAGSAIADSYLNVPISNITSIDMIVRVHIGLQRKKDPIPYRNSEWANYWHSMFKMKGYDEIKCLGDRNTFKELNRHIQAVWELTTNGKKYNIILVNKDPRKYVEENFDFGISMSYCDGTRMHFTNEFLEDVLNETLTLYPDHLTSTQLMYAQTEQAKKLARKYPGWKLKI